MSNLIHCDGPGCAKTKTVHDDPRLCTPGWLMLEQPGGPALDFHDQACLASWSMRQTSTAANLPCTCHRAQTKPHSKADHQAYPTVVDGL